MALVTFEELRAALNLTTASYDGELALYLDAATEYIEERVGTLPSAEYTETVTVANGRLMTTRWPVLSVESVEDDYGNSYSADFTIANGAYAFTHDSITSGEWTVTYTAGFASVPASLKLALLEDIRGLYQPGQIGPPGGFMGMDTVETGPTFRPVIQWPRIDAWITARYGPAIA